MKKKTYPLYYAGQKAKYARSVVVGDLVFVSGATGRSLETGDFTSDDIKEQMTVALDNIRGALEECGSSMNNIVKTVIYLKRLEDYAVMRATEEEYYQKYAPLLVEDPPASTFMEVGLALPGFLFEMDVVGVISRE